MPVCVFISLITHAVFVVMSSVLHTQFVFFFSSFGWLPSSYFMVFFFNLSFLTWLVLVLLPDIISCFLNDCLPYFYCLHLWFFAFSCIFSTSYVLSLVCIIIFSLLILLEYVVLLVGLQPKLMLMFNYFFEILFLNVKVLFLCLFFDCSFCFLSRSCIWVILSEPWQKLFWRAHKWHMLRSSLRDFFQGIESKSSFSFC